MKNRVWEFITSHLHEIVETKTTPHSIATGFSLGTFISILPIPGFSILIATLIVLMFTRISKIAIFVAMSIWNPVTLIPIYSLSYQIGMYLLKHKPTYQFDLTVLNRVYYFTNDFLLGNLIVAFLISFLFFFIVFDIIKIYRTKKKLN